MRQGLAFFFGRLFIFFFNLCGRLDTDMAFGLLKAMCDVLDRQDKIQAVQDNYRRAVNERNVSEIERKLNG